MDLFVKVIMMYVFSCDILFWYFLKFTSMFMHMPVFHVSLLYNIPLYYCYTVLSALLFTRVGFIAFSFRYWRQCCCGRSVHVHCKLCVPCCIQCWEHDWHRTGTQQINVWGMWCFSYPSCMCSSRTAVLRSLNICSHDTTEVFFPFTAFHGVIVLVCCQAHMCMLWVFKSPL